MRKIPFKNSLKALVGKRFAGSSHYWEKRYQTGLNSGSGSYGRLAEFKAEILNQFVYGHGVTSVIEFGSGDGHQLSLANYPSYVGVDVSQEAIRLCKQKFAQDLTKEFILAADSDGQQAELALSLDVIYHLVEDEVFHQYMNRLFDSARRFVVIYSSNTDDNRLFNVPHVRMRNFSTWIDQHAPQWRLIERIDNRYPYDRRNPNETSFADFYFYEKSEPSTA